MYDLSVGHPSSTASISKSFGTSATKDVGNCLKLTRKMINSNLEDKVVPVKWCFGKMMGYQKVPTCPWKMMPQ